jgi:outer membrane protein assembly factor BamB
VGAGIGLALRPQESPAAPVPPPTVPDRPTWSIRVDGAVRALALGDGFVCAAGLGSQLHLLDQGTGQVRWSHTVRRQVLSPPAVLGGRIGVADSDSLYMIDAASGALLWESPMTSMPQAAGDLLLAGRYEGNSRTSLVALDPVGGQVRWSAPALTGASMTTTSPIAVGDGAAFAVLGAAVTAVDLGTGQPRWQVGTGLDEHSASRLMLTGPVDGIVLLTVPFGTNGDGEFIALDAATGAVRWRRAPQYGVQYPPVIDGGIVVFEMASSSVLGWDLATGDDRWAREGLSEGWGLIKTYMVAARGTSYFGGESQVYGDDGHSVVDAAGEPAYQSQLFALDSATGEIRWRLQVEATYAVHAPLVADQGLVVLGTEDGTIHAIRT